MNDIAIATIFNFITLEKSSLLELYFTYKYKWTNPWQSKVWTANDVPIRVAVPRLKHGFETLRSTAAGNEEISSRGDFHRKILSDKSPWKEKLEKFREETLPTFSGIGILKFKRSSVPRERRLRFEVEGSAK